MDLNLLDEMRDRVGASALGKPAVAGVVTLLVVVAVIAAGRLIGTATATQFQVEPAGSQPASAVAAEGGVLPGESLFVHVSGEVANPGLFEVPAGSRVADAVQAAGGFTSEAATGSVNLARPLVDGEQVVVAAQADQAAGDGSQPARADNASVTPGLVNINTATSSQLQELPGIGKSTAEKIVDDRRENGPFATKEDLKRVSGIGDKKYDAIADLICV